MNNEEKWINELKLLDIFYCRQISKLVNNPTNIRNDVLGRVKTIVDSWEYEKEKLKDKLNKRGVLNYG
jgi:hypothetical protein